jgi:16S rRNA (adenine1518-N6/adenine1519-N6)-dimethyltransferase
MNYKAKKRFGQNFLIDELIINQIINTINAQKDETIIEIGPGLGALTKPLLNQVANLNVIEIDNDIVAQLNSWQVDNLTIHHCDVLKFDFTTLGTEQKVIGNLPYNISSPILFNLLQQRDNIKEMFFMLQKEVVERITSKPNTKVYGRLSVMMQTFFDTELLFLVPPESFSPAPKIESAIVYLKPKKNITINFQNLEKIVRMAFSQRRKMLRNTLKPILNNLQTTIDLNQRAEMLSIEDFAQLTQNYEEQY